MKRKFLALLVALVAVLVLPVGVALADGGVKPFTASGAIEQTAPGSSSVTAVSAVQTYVPADLYNGLVSLLPFGGNTPGLLTPGQAFSGKLTESKWGALKKANVAVAHNSWVAADLSSGMLVGLAWGTFGLTKGDENELSAGYAALITGSVVVDFTCPVDPVLQAPLRIAVADVGGWQVIPGSADGAYEQIQSQGGLEVNAEGCLHQEQATFAVSGARVGGD